MGKNSRASEEQISSVVENKKQDNHLQQILFSPGSYVLS